MAVADHSNASARPAGRIGVKPDSVDHRVHQ
jgi:hypothetical protein